MVLAVYTTSLDSPVLGEEGLTDLDLAIIYVGGGIASGLVGGLLWPYQRSRWETLVFSVPTALPVYVLAGLAMGLSLGLSLWVGFLSGVLYALFFGGQHADG